MTTHLNANQRKIYIQERRVVTLVLSLVGIVGMVISMALTPKVLLDIEKTTRLRNADGFTQGKVVAHNVLVEKYTKKNSSATIAYMVGDTEFHTYARGYGALPEQLPIGSSIDVLYLTSDPAVSEALREGLRPERYSWFTMVLMWGFSFAFLTLAAISYKSLMSFK